MRNIAILIRILAVVGFLFLPKAFNYWKAIGHGSAIRQHFSTAYVDIDLMSDSDLKAMSDQYLDEGYKCATFMVLGFNLPFFACLFLSTFIATPRKIDTDQKLFLWLYLGFVVLGLAFQPFGHPYFNPNLQEFSVSFVVSCMYWLLLGGVPIAIALLSRHVLIKKMKKQVALGVIDYNDANKLFKVATKHEAKGNIEKSIALYEEIINIYPSSPAASDAKISIQQLNKLNCEQIK